MGLPNSSSTPVFVGGGSPETSGTAGGLSGAYGNAVAQAAAITPVVTTATTQTTPFGFATQAQGDALVSQLNAVILALKNYGITL
jgi:hypothetical protein